MNGAFLVAIYGNDGAGKSTLVRNVREQLSNEEVSCDVFDKWDILSPAFSPETGFLKPDLDGLRVSIARMQGLSRTLFLFWTIAASMRTRSQADVILLDGYWFKHGAAEIAMGADPELVRKLGEALPKPDVSILLDVDPHVAALRKQHQFTPYECGCIEACSLELFIRHQTRVRLALTEFNRRDGGVSIDASLSAREVLRKVMEQIRPVIRSVTEVGQR